MSDIRLPGEGPSGLGEWLVAPFIWLAACALIALVGYGLSFLFG